jgi:hypothetical protein
VWFFILEPVTSAKDWLIFLAPPTRLNLAYYNQALAPRQLDTLQEAVKRTPDSATLHYHLGMAYEKANNHAMAKEGTRAGIADQPELHNSEANKIRKILAE